MCTGNWGCGAFGGDKQLKCESASQLAQLSSSSSCDLCNGKKASCASDYENELDFTSLPVNYPSLDLLVAMQQKENKLCFTL